MSNASNIFHVYHIGSLRKENILAPTRYSSFQSFSWKYMQKQSTRGIHIKRCSEKMQQIYRRTPMSKCNFTHFALRHGCSPVNLLHFFRTPFPENTSGWLLLYMFIGICTFGFWGETLDNVAVTFTSLQGKSSLKSNWVSKCCEKDYTSPLLFVYWIFNVWILIINYFSKNDAFSNKGGTV